jgi:periplasmic protein CpxP/Spy
MTQQAVSAFVAGETNVSTRNYTLGALALAAMLGGTAALPVDAAFAQGANPAPAPAAPQQQAPRVRPSHVEGRIAYMKAELKITSAQEAQFDKVAQALRQNDTERRQSFTQIRAERRNQTALQRLEAQARFSAMRAQQSDRFLAAFRPLYDSLSSDQKKAADDLFGGHMRRFGHHRA